MKTSLIRTLMTLVSLAGFAFPLSAQESTAPVRRAVVVGVDVYQDSFFSPLRGCGNDAKAVAGLLQTKFGFKPEEIVLLTDNDVTLEKLRETMKKSLVDDLPADGVGVFYYAGHGVQTPDLDGDETDGLDEALVLHDTQELNFGSYLVDDEIHTLLTSIKTQNMLVVLDTCHSGTANRTAAKFAEFRTTKINWQAAAAQASRSAKPEEMVRGGSGHVIFAACQPDEVANELVGKDFENLKDTSAAGSCGLFTWSFRNWLASGANADLALGEAATSLEAIVVKAVKDTGKSNPQRPWFDLGGRSSVSIATFLAGKAGTPEAVAETTAQPAAQPPITFTSEGVALGGAIPLELKMNQRVFNEGEKLVIEAKAEEDCFVRLYYMNVKGEITQLFPNEHHQDNFLPKGKTVRVPGVVSGFELEMGAPYGVEALKLVASNHQFTDLQNLDWASGIFQQVNIESLQEMTFRGVNTKETEIRYGHATGFYKVLDPDEPAVSGNNSTSPEPEEEPANGEETTPEKP